MLSYEDIQAMGLFELYEQAELDDVPIIGCETIDEVRERFYLHKGKVEGKHRHFMDAAVYETMHTELKRQHDSLREIVQCIQTSLGENIPFLAKIFKSCGTSDDLLQEFNDQLTSLQNSECNIVIAGQTNAGKSTLLNLLLGMDVLPKSVLSCTSSICKLHYGPKFKVKVTDGGIDNGVERIKELKDAKETMIYLRDLVAVENIYAREEGDIVREVDVYLPATILKSGVTFVDTPGFGENDAMDELLRTFINKGRVSAFIYVIKTDSAGGVQEDRLVKFLKTFLEQNTSASGSPKFDPRAALFVCNRWDMIKDEEKMEIRDNVMEKLTDIWPNLDQKQVRFISTKKSRSNLDVDREYVTEELHLLVESIQCLFSLAQQCAVETSYRWLKAFMKDSTRYLKTILSQICVTEKEHEHLFKNAYTQLDALQSRADEMMCELKEELELKTTQMIHLLGTILQYPSTLSTITNWKESEIPKIESLPGAWESMKLEIDSLIVNKIFRMFDNMEECAQFVSNLKSSMLNKVKRKLLLLDGDMKEITTDLNCGTSLRSSSSSSTSLSSLSDDERCVVNGLNKVGLAVRLKEYAKKTRDFNRFDPRAFACRVIAPFIDQMVKTTNSRRPSAMAENPCMVLNRRAEKVIVAMGKDQAMLRRLALRYTSSIVQQINNISSNIPTFIKANEVLMANITVYRKTAKEERGRMKLMMEQLEPHKELLRGFGCLNLNDIVSDDVLLQVRITASTMIKVETFPAPSDKSDQSCRRNLWTTMQKADLTVDDQKSAVMLKSYIIEPPEQQIYKEIARLRCLECPSVATFIGMTRKSLVAAFVFDEHLTSARRYLRRSSTKVKDVVPVMLSQCLEGLEHIHRDGLVHMEFSLDTIMMNNEGQVKLCNMCLPRKCVFPSNMDALCAEDFTCLSPMVLRGNLYSKSSDVYGFGIVVYELLLQKAPYSLQRQWPLSRFINEGNPAMLNLGEETISDVVSDILKSCLFSGQGVQLPLVTLKEMARRLKGDPCLIDLRSSRRRPVRRRSSTQPVYNRLVCTVDKVTHL